MHLCREHQTWTFRRRVPRQLQERLGQAEVYRSLATTCKREARKLAAVLYAATEELFALAEDETITNDDLRTAARLWLDTPRWRQHLRFHVDELLPGPLRRQRGEIPRRHLTHIQSDESPEAPEDVEYDLLPFGPSFIMRVLGCS